MSRRPVVAIARSDSPREAVRKALQLLGGIEIYVKPGDRVVIKPNLAYPYPPPATTDPRVVQAVAELCFEAGAAWVGIGDSSSYSCKDILGVGRWTNAEVIRRTGMDVAAANAGASIIDFDRDAWVEVEIPGGIILRRAEIARAMLEADVVINMPALKTHFETLVTLGIKNYHGILPDRYKIQWHKDEINQKVVDLHKVVRTHLTVLDGMVGMEGLGPRLGGSVRMDLVIAGNDVVAVDAVASAVMGFAPMEAETTRLAHVQEIGCGDLTQIDLRGERLETVRKPFARPDVRIDGFYPGLTVIKGGPCIHCYGRARIFMDTLIAAGAKDYAGISHLLVGIRPRNPELHEITGKVVFVGDCAIESSSNLRYALGMDALCLEGCPPIPSVHRVVERLTGRM